MGQRKVIAPKSRGFISVIESESLNDVVNACQEAMCSLTMKQRESGSVGFEQKCKSLQGRWMEKSVGETNGSAGEDAQNPYSERNRLITVEVGGKEDRKECYFCILGNYTKSYNK